MDISLLLRGILIGLSLAAPVGPIGVLTIRRTLAHGRLTGFVSGMGTATADALYGLVGALGLTVISTALTSQAFWLRLVGGLFLCYLGVRTFISKPAENAAQTKPTRAGLLGTYTSAFVLTLTNPMTILTFAGIFAGMNIAQLNTGYSAAVWVVLGVFAGSALWWLGLSWAASLLRAKLTAKILVWVNRLSGIIVIGVGLAALTSSSS
jgi:threonine/homoserine/homoserine lactone efflux protein